jgi:hypothetical protein
MKRDNNTRHELSHVANVIVLQEEEGSHCIADDYDSFTDGIIRSCFRGVWISSLSNLNYSSLGSV